MISKHPRTGVEGGMGRLRRPIPPSTHRKIGGGPDRSATNTSLRVTPNTWLIQTQPGLETIAWEEVTIAYSEALKAPPEAPSSTRGSQPIEVGKRVVPGRAGMCLFSAVSFEPLLKLRCAEDLFAVIAYSRPRGTKEKSLENVRNASRAAPYVDSALQARVKLMPGSRSGARLKFRVIARIVGDQEFRRAEFKRAVERGISERGDRSWRLDEENAEVEFWATLIRDEMFLALRLSDEHLRHRDYKAAHIPGSLRPSVAAALGVLATPQLDDIVLDPFCGAGTVLIERAHLARYRQLIGGDNDEAALEAAHLNIGPRYQPIELHSWDATAVPMPDRSVSRIITNLPWGAKHGSHADNRRLYPRVLGEFARLLKPDGLAVMLTGEQRLMNELLRGGALRPTRVARVSILGMPAAIYVCRKAG